MERMIVTTAGRPSGIAATARAIAAIKVSSAVSPSIFHENGSLLRNTPSMIPTANTTAHMMITSFVRNTDNSAIFF